MCFIRSELIFNVLFFTHATCLTAIFRFKFRLKFFEEERVGKKKSDPSRISRQTQGYWCLCLSLFLMLRKIHPNCLFAISNQLSKYLHQVPCGFASCVSTDCSPARTHKPTGRTFLPQMYKTLQWLSHNYVNIQLLYSGS